MDNPNSSYDSFTAEAPVVVSDKVISWSNEVSPPNLHICGGSINIIKI
jgi:hypothetical protein